MHKSRLEPITRKSPVHRSNAQDTGISMPSTHWRGLFSELPALATPVHHLFSPPAACRSGSQTPGTAKEQKHCTESQPSRPASCPSSLCSSQPAPSENVSYTAFRKSLAVVTADLKLPPLNQMPHVPPGEHCYERAARYAVHSQRAAIVGVHCHPSTLAGKSCLDQSFSPVRSAVDLAHGAQGVVSKLCGHLHGPGALLRSMPVKDLTSQVPIRKGQASHTTQSCHMMAHPGLAFPASFCSNEVFRNHGAGHQAEGGRPRTQPVSIAPHSQSAPQLKRMPLQSLMTAVHEVSEILHMLSRHHQDLAQAFFERLISCALANPAAAHCGQPDKH